MAQARLVRTVSSVRELVGSWRAARLTVAFVPTMGNLHEGHLSLTRLAAASADVVVLSIFVNPTQFGPGEDFAAYPRTLDEDWARLDQVGTVEPRSFPEVAEIYPFGTEQAVKIAMPPLSRELCGASRPGHFDGVGDGRLPAAQHRRARRAVLGQKDYQQVILLKQMVADLHLPVRVVVGRQCARAMDSRSALEPLPEAGRARSVAPGSARDSACAYAIRCATAARITHG